MKIIKTRNFTLNEVIHHEPETFPQELIPLAAAAMNYVQCLRDVLKVPIIITSGYRSSGYNAAIGGAKNSHHIWRLDPDGTMVWALDLSSPALEPEILFLKLKELVHGEVYLHSKLGFCHISPQGLREVWIQ